MSHQDSQTWRSTQIQNLVRYVPSGTYYALFKTGGKRVRKSLKTDVLSVAKLRLPDLIKERRVPHSASSSAIRGKMNFGDALNLQRERIKNNPRLKPNSKI